MLAEQVQKPLNWSSSRQKPSWIALAAAANVKRLRLMQNYRVVWANAKFARQTLQMEPTPGRKTGDGLKFREPKAGGKFSCRASGWTE